MPGVTFAVARRFDYQGDDTLELRGREPSGKIRAIDITAGGLVVTPSVAEVRADFQKRVGRVPDGAVPYCDLAIALADRGLPDEAVKYFAQALELDPKSFMAHSSLALLLVEMGRANEALVHFRRAIELDPEVAFPYRQMAELLRQQGKTTEAEEYERRAAKASKTY